MLIESRTIIPKARTPVQLTTGPLRFGAPTPSSDGKKLFVIGAQPRVELTRYDATSKRFVPYLAGLSAGPLDISRDRQWIAYVAYPEMTLWRARADGSERIQITFPPTQAYLPRWSPNGERIVFQDVQAGKPWRLLVVSANGGNSQSLLPDDKFSEADPTWSPDGNAIIFGRSNLDSNLAVFRLELKTHQVSTIPGSTGMFSPRMSPDGRYIAALTTGDAKLMLYDVASSKWSQLAASQSGGNEWSHNSRYVYVADESRGFPEIVRINVNNRQLDRVLNLKDFALSPDWFADWQGLDADDALLVMRDKSIEEIYALDLQSSR
jgi:Tol biopolymer transport system component